MTGILFYLPLTDTELKMWATSVYMLYCINCIIISVIGNKTPDSAIET